MTSSQPATIRPARRGDIPGILRTIEPYVKRDILVPRGEDDLRKLLPNGFVAESRGTIVGFAALEIYSTKLGEIQCLAVAEDYQQQGLGKQLVAACVERAREEKVWELLAITSYDTFLRSCGFEYSLPDQRRALFLRPGSSRKQPE